MSQRDQESPGPSRAHAGPPRLPSLQCTEQRLSGVHDGVQEPIGRPTLSGGLAMISRAGGEDPRRALYRQLRQPAAAPSTRQRRAANAGSRTPGHRVLPLRGSAPRARVQYPGVGPRLRYNSGSKPAQSPSDPARVKMDNARTELLHGKLGRVQKASLMLLAAVLAYALPASAVGTPVAFAAGSLALL